MVQGSGAGHIDELDAVSKEALLWRIDAERALRAVDARPNVMVVLYKNLCRDPFRTAGAVFCHCDLDLSAQTKGFIQATISPSR